MRRQRDCGLDVITDGEFRRWMFMNSFYDAVSGVRTGKTVTFRNDRGEDVELAVHEIVAPLEQVDSPAAREAAFMREVAGDTPFKVTFPAASIFAHPFTTVDGRVRLGGGVRRCRGRDRTTARRRRDRRQERGYVQFDFPLYPYLCRPCLDRAVQGGRARRRRRLVRAASPPTRGARGHPR